MAALGATTMQSLSSRRAFSGTLLPQSQTKTFRTALPKRQAAQALFRKKAEEPEPEEEEEEENAPGFSLKNLFGGGAGGTRQLRARDASDGSSQRGGDQSASRKPGASQRVQATPKRGAAKEGVRRGTQRVGQRRGTQRVGLGGGTTRIGGRAGGTTRIGGQAKTQGPRGLFGGRAGRRDMNLVFVAGGTGRLGSRIVRQLLSQGLKVRAGVRDVEKAQGYIDTAVAYGLLPRDAARKIALVEYDITDPDTIPSAIGNAAKVVSAIGAAEALDFSAPKKIDGQGGINLVNAAKAARVEHFVMVTSLGTGKFGWPAGILNLFGGVLIQKKKAEEALEASGLQYTIVRPGGMERPGDDFKETHNVTFQPRDTLFGGQVSRLQVAEVVGATIARSDLAENKVLEVVAETDAPRREIELLLADLPSEAAQADRAATAAAVADAEQMLEAAQQEQQFLADEAADLRESVADLQASQEEAPNQRAAQKAARSLQEAERKLEMVEEAAQQAQREEAAAKAVLQAAQAAQKQRQALTAQEAERIQQDILFPPTPEELQERREAEQRAKAEAAEAERLERQRQADEARQAREAAAAEQKRAADERAAQAKAEADAKRQAEEQKRKSEAEARAKAEAEARQKREAEEQARAEAKAKADKEAAEKKAAEDKKRSEAEAKAKADAEAKRKAEEEARAKAKKEADAKAKADADAQAKQEADAAKATAKAAADAQQKQSAPKADSEDDAAKAEAAAKLARENAAEARKWIQNWRDGGVTYSGAPKPEQEQQGGGLFGGGFRWPWSGGQQQQPQQPQQPQQQQTSAKQADGGSTDGLVADIEANKQAARKWINDWRARTLETKLPKDQNAKTK